MDLLHAALLGLIQGATEVPPAGLARFRVDL